MKTYKIEFKEITMYEFYVEAESEKEAVNEFCEKVHKNEIDFSDGWVEYSYIDSVKESA